MDPDAPPTEPGMPPPPPDDPDEPDEPDEPPELEGMDEGMEEEGMEELLDEDWLAQPPIRNAETVPTAETCAASTSARRMARCIVVSCEGTVDLPACIVGTPAGRERNCCGEARFAPRPLCDRRAERMLTIKGSLRKGATRGGSRTKGFRTSGWDWSVRGHQGST